MASGTVYKNKAGKRVKRTTTIINRFKESGGLVYWAWDLGMQGIDYRDERNKAADAGTIAHEMIESYFTNNQFDSFQYDHCLVEIAKTAFESFLQWYTHSPIKPLKASNGRVMSEVQLVSEKYQYGGTIDLVAFYGDKLCLFDWKTSKSLREDYFIQLAAYKKLWEENYPSHPIAGFHCIRLGKQKNPTDPVSFNHSYHSNLDASWRCFETMLTLYDQLAEQKKVNKV